MAAVVDLWREHPSRAGQTDAAGPPRARCKLAVAPYRLQGALALITTNSTPALGGYGESPPLELSRRFAGCLVKPMRANAGLLGSAGLKAVD